MNNLRAVRAERGVAQAGLAALSGVSPAVICNTEKWGYTPKPSTKQKLADALGVPITAIWPNG
jgi:DNA-binding XRE family transcriptional regulator